MSPIIYLSIYQSQNLTTRNWRVYRQGRGRQGRRGQGRVRQGRAEGQIKSGQSKSRAERGQKAGQGMMGMGIVQYE